MAFVHSIVIAATGRLPSGCSRARYAGRTVLLGLSGRARAMTAVQPRRPLSAAAMAANTPDKMDKPKDAKDMSKRPMEKGGGKQDKRNKGKKGNRGK